MTRHDLSNELRRIGNLDTVRRGVPGPPSYNATQRQHDEWKRELAKALKALNKARAQYRPRALAALEALRTFAAEPKGWHPSQGTVESWEKQLDWATAEPFDVDAKVRERDEWFEAARSRFLFGNR